MKLRKISLGGLTNYNRDTPSVVDLEVIGDGLIAVTGPNGSGKTTLLDCVCLVLYRTFPTRPGSVYDHAHGTDAFGEVIFENDAGHSIRARLLIDSERRKSESYLFEGPNSLTNGLNAEFDAEVLKRFGSKELFLASCFSAQNKAGNFLLLPKRDRKGLMAELLGLSRIVELHLQASRRELLSTQTLSLARLAVESAEAEVERLPELEKQLPGYKRDADDADHVLDQAREAEVEAVATLERARVAGEKLAALKKALESASRELTAAEVSLSIAKAAGPNIEAQIQARRDALNLMDPDALESRARERHINELESISDQQKRLEVTISGEPEIDAAIKELGALEIEGRGLERAEEEVDHIRSREKAARGALEFAEQSYKLKQSNREGELGRLERQIRVLRSVPCTDSETWAVVSDKCPLLADAKAAEGARDKLRPPDTLEVAQAQKRLEELKAEVRQASLSSDPLRLQEIIKRMSALRQLAAGKPRIAEARVELDGMTKARLDASVSLGLELEEADAARGRIVVQLVMLDEELKTSLEDAAKKLGEAQDNLERAKSRRTPAALEFAIARKSTEGGISSAETALDVAKRNREQAEVELRAAVQVLAGATAQVEQLREKYASIEGLRQKVSEVEIEVGDWSLLSKALGRDGIQALEIDASGPEVAKLVNELLESCYGARFSIAFETLREKVKARGEYTEVFDVMVFDQGVARAAEALSGGEKVVVGEAIGLALSIFNARKSGIRWRTLFRDETSGALDAENAQAYVEMLRRALSLGGFSQVIFVSHSRDVWERADARIIVEDGRVSVCGVE